MNKLVCRAVIKSTLCYVYFAIALYQSPLHGENKPNAFDVDLLITNATIISPQDKRQVTVKSGHWLAIKDGRITAIENHKQQPRAKQRLNAQGQYLIPGLMDSHTHLSTMPGLNRDTDHWQAMQQHFKSRQGANYLYYGVTQVVDLANTPTNIAEFNASGVGPMAFFCGAMPVYGGYNAEGIPYHVLHKRRPYYIQLANDPVADPDISALHTPKAALHRMHQDGAVCGKVFIEDGFGAKSHLPILDKQSLSLLISEATKLEIPIIAHANATDMQGIAADHKVSAIAHGLWNWLTESLTRDNNTLPPKVESVLDTIIAEQIVYQPTLTVIRALRDVVVEQHILLPSYGTVLPQWQQQWYQSTAGQWFADQMIADWGGASRNFIIARFSQILARGERALAYLYQQGGTVVLASDTTPAPTYAAQPGLATAMELKHMHKVGVDLVGLLSAATLNNAKTFGLEDDFGSVEVGKIANLLLLRDNPLATIEAYDEIESVILQGRVIPRQSLHIDALDQQSPF